MSAVIEVAHLRKKYGALEAVRDISFSVEEGEIFGIVGPNGAGKTTTVECMEGLRDITSGEVRILGKHPQRDANFLKHQIGIQLQESILPDRIKVKEALQLFSTLYGHQRDYTALVDQLGLTEKRNSYYDALSGGQKQRLSIAMSLLHDPKVVFFDELTTGLDPQARRTIWALVEQVRDMGKTVILVTHFMEEAERLCDRVAIIDHGKLVALDAPRELIRSLGGKYHIQFQAEVAEAASATLLALDGVVEVLTIKGGYRVEVTDIQAVATVITALTEMEIAFYDFTLQQPNLEDVFIQRTGRALRD